MNIAKPRRYQTLLSLILIILSIILLIRDFHDSNHGLFGRGLSTATNSSDNKIPTTSDAIKFDFYTVLPKMAVINPINNTNSGLKGQYQLQLASVRGLKDAQHLQDDWQKKGYPTFIQKYQRDNQEVWYRILLGPFPTPEVGQQIQEQLKQKHYDSLLLKL